MKKILTLSLLALSVSMANAEMQNVVENNSPVIEIEKTLPPQEDSVTGVTYEMNENGEFARIRSTGRAELDIGDQKDIRMALQKAQMRAKANMAKFLSERVTTEEVIETVTKQTNTATNNSSKTTRESVENYMEKIQNSAETILKGVITTKTDVNKQDKYVEVEVGYSPKTQSAADTINNNLKIDLSNGSSGVSAPAMQSGSEGREIKKSKNYDNF